MSERATCTHCGELEPNWWGMNNVRAFHWWRKHGGKEAFTKQRRVRARCHEQWLRIHDGQSAECMQIAADALEAGAVAAEPREEGTIAYHERSEIYRDPVTGLPRD